MPMLLLTGCGTGSKAPVSNTDEVLLSIRGDLRPYLREHAEALIERNPDKSLITGAEVIERVDAALSPGG